jgi:hypothetical protein
MARGLTTITEGVEDDDELSFTSKDLNYHAVVMTGMNVREELESKAREGQKKQANDVNRARFGEGSEVIGKWTVCTLGMSMDRHEFTPKNLPVLVCGHNYYKKSNTIRYRLYTENGILKGTYGREQLTPCPDVSAASLGIDNNSLDKNNCITQTEAGEMYVQTGWETNLLLMQEGLQQV